jgi:hypothetical protein
MRAGDKNISALLDLFSSSWREMAALFRIVVKSASSQQGKDCRKESGGNSAQSANNQTKKEEEKKLVRLFFSLLFLDCRGHQEVLYGYLNNQIHDEDEREGSVVVICYIRRPIILGPQKK